MNKFTLPIFLILVSVGVFVLYINPQYKEIKSLMGEDTRYTEARDKSKEIRVVRDDLLKKYGSFSADNISRLKKMLPDNIDNVRLIMDIDSIASKYGITIRDVKVMADQVDEASPVIVDESSSNYDFVDLSFTAFSSYDNFILFLTDLKNSLRVVDVTHIDFSGDQGSGLYKYNLNIKTYWLK